MGCLCGEVGVLTSKLAKRLHLPRSFYSPRQRRSLEAAEAAGCANSIMWGSGRLSLRYLLQVLCLAQSTLCEPLCAPCLWPWARCSAPPKPPRPYSILLTVGPCHRLTRQRGNLAHTVQQNMLCNGREKAGLKRRTAFLLLLLGFSAPPYPHVFTLLMSSMWSPCLTSEVHCLQTRVGTHDMIPMIRLI
jgi:hypothetical protein